MADLTNLHKSAQKALGAALQTDESVEVVVPGESKSALVATDRRVLLFKKGIASGAMFGRQVNSWDYVNVSGIEVKQGMTTAALVVQVPGVAPVTEYGRFGKGPNSVWEAPNAIFASTKGAALDDAVARLRDLVAHHQQRPSPAVAAAPDPVDQIRRLAELRDEGILSAEEFEAKKRQLLNI